MRSWRDWTGWRAAGLGLVALVVAGALVALAGGGGGGDDDSGPADAAQSSAADQASPADAGVEGAAPEEDAVEAEATADEPVAGGSGAGGSEPVGALAAVPAGGPRVVKTADLRVEVAEEGFAEALERAGAVARANGGFVVSSSTSSFERGSASGEVTIRVPSGAFDAARADLAGLGELASEQVDGEDVSAQLVDLAARLRSLRAEEEALNTLLARAGNVGEVLSVRDRISGVRTSIEQLAAQEQALDDAATFSTLTVALFEPAAGPPPPTEPPADDGTDLADSVRTAVDAAVAVLGGMIVVVGAVAPFAALALLAWLVVRLVQSRRRPVPVA